NAMRVVLFCWALHLVSECGANCFDLNARVCWRSLKARRDALDEASSEWRGSVGSEAWAKFWRRRQHELGSQGKMGGMRANGKTCDSRKARGRYLQMC